MKQNKLVAVTGGIGSGKSAVLGIIKDLNYPVFSCDDFTQKAYKQKRVKAFIKEFCPECFYGIFNNKINRKILSKSVFSSPLKKEQFSLVLTPVVFDLTIKKANKKKGLKFIEVPLLFEFGYDLFFDGVIVVKRDIIKRQKAVEKRSKITKEEFIKIVNSQYDYKDLKNATVIDNDGDFIGLKDKVVLAIEKFL